MSATGGSTHSPAARARARACGARARAPAEAGGCRNSDGPTHSDAITATLRPRARDLRRQMPPGAAMQYELHLRRKMPPGAAMQCELHRKLLQLDSPSPLVSHTERLPSCSAMLVTAFWRAELPAAASQAASPTPQTACRGRGPGERQVESRADLRGAGEEGKGAVGPRPRRHCADHDRPLRTPWRRRRSGPWRWPRR